MTRRIEAIGQTLIWKKYGMILRVEPWGPDAVRVRVTRNRQLPEDTEVLLPPAPAETETTCRNEKGKDLGLATGITDLETLGADLDGRIVNGQLTVELAESILTFRNTDDGRELLRGRELIICAGEGQSVTGALTARGSDRYEAKVEFSAYEGERIYGMGQHRHGYLDQKGCVLDLVHHNCEVNIPFALSSRGYGFMWNNPAVGRAEFGRTRTLWTAGSTAAIDYVVIAGDTPARILARYAGLTGHAPRIPEWATGFWQCKLRYKNQEELLAVAREHKKRGLPISALVIDYLHWTHMGDWKFDPQAWPDPHELRALEIEPVVSVWPTVSKTSENFTDMMRDGLLVGADHGVPVMLSFTDKGEPEWEGQYLSDPTNPANRDFVWSRIRENYGRYGIRAFWLDAIEPELISHFPDLEHIRYHAGPATETCGLYPWYAQKTFHDGLAADGENEILTLGRSAFLGSQRFGAAVWNGDIKSSFEMLAASIPAGLNMALSGIPWWTTDIGGFHGGDPDSPYFQELIIRWFQYGVFCPLFRLHGFRKGDPNAPNEVWRFGDAAYGHIKTCLTQRERLRPYIKTHMQVASETGLPMMRPLLVDFYDDPKAWGVEDQFLFGPDILVAPVVQEGARARRVYLPRGSDWIDTATQETHEGGQTLDASAPLDRIPVYLRKGHLDACFPPHWEAK